MAKIYKYLLHTTDQQNLELPEGAEILTAQIQSIQGLVLWAKVDEYSVVTETRDIRIHGTGHTFDDTNYKYISTFQLSGGALVFHVFEHLK